MRPEIEIKTGVIQPIECFKEGFEAIKSDYWLFFAMSLVAAMIGGMTLFIGLGPMMCGLFYTFIKRVDDGQPVVFDDLWKGMRWFRPAIVVTICIVVPILSLYAVIYVPIIVAAVMGGRMSDNEVLSLIGSAILFDVIFAVLMVCFHTLLMFSFPLIVDRSLGPIAAMRLSARAVLKNLKGVVGLMMVSMLLGIAGVAVCIGTYFLMPIMIAANVVAYRKIFPAVPQVRI